MRIENESLLDKIVSFIKLAMPIGITCYAAYVSTYKTIEYSVENNNVIAAYFIKEPEFNDDDFDDKSIVNICNKLKSDKYVIPILTSKENSVHWLNELLNTPGLYKQIYEKNNKIKLTSQINKLWGALDNKSHVYAELSPLDQKSLVRLNRLIIQSAYNNDIPVKLNDAMRIIAISVMLAIIIFGWRVYNAIIMGYIKCDSYPNGGNKLCTHIHNYLIQDRQFNIFKDSVTGDRIPAKPEGSCCFSFSGTLVKYLRVIETIAPNYNIKYAVKMTLPYSPYEQIKDNNNYEAFRNALHRVKRIFLGHKKCKLIELSEGELEKFVVDLVSDIRSNTNPQIDTYIKLHYRKGFLSWVFSRFINIDLKWQCKPPGKEFIFIKHASKPNSISLVYENGIVRDGRIVIDFDAEAYLEFDNQFLTAYQTKEFFNRYVLPKVDGPYQAEVLKLIAAW
jgi:hypothetical protein